MGSDLFCDYPLRPRPKVVFFAHKLDIVEGADGTRHLVGVLFGHLVFLFLEILTGTLSNRTSPVQNLRNSYDKVW